MTLITGIVHYGVGNIGSIVSAFRKLNVDSILITREDDIKHCDIIVLPGVGSFDSAVTRLRLMLPDLDKLVGNMPIFGICLGMQIMFERSEEGIERGLCWFKGHVTKIRSDIVPHIGWNTVKIVQESIILEGIPDESYFYFAHSYCVELSNVDTSYVAGVTEAGQSRFVSIIADEKRLIFGTQFHPERSSKTGLALLRNLVKLARR